MPNGYDVAALGNAIVDVIAPVTDDFLLEHNIGKGVMTLVDEYRAGQLYEAITEPRVIAGGSAANTLAGMASLGGQGLFVGKVRQDALGECFAASMTEAGIAYGTPMAPDGPGTGCSLIVVTPDGERSMSTFLGASREMSESDIDAAEIGRAEILYIEGYLWDAEGPKSAIRAGMRAARNADRKVALTLSDPFCVSRYRGEFLNLLKADIDILFANEEEAKSLFEADSFEQALQFLRGWHGLLAMTRSEKGCVIAQDDTLHVLEAVPVSRVVDTTGAGDQFAAGFLFGLTHGHPLDSCGRLGALAAAEIISHYGARPETSLAVLAQRQGLF